MKVSIITATYNSEKTIEKCMNSVLNQTYKNIEYIIMDGQSKDDTLDIIKLKKELHTNIIVNSEKDKGIYDALNKGITRATGDIIGFVHSDDFLAKKNIIEIIVDAFIKFNVDGVYGDLHYVALNNTNKVIRNWISQPFSDKLLNRGWMPAHPTLFLKKDIYNKHGFFNLKYKIAADYDFMLRIFKNELNTWHYLPETIVKMRIGGKSNKNLSNIIQKTKEDYNAAKENKLKNPAYVIFVKNLSKIKQLIKK